MKINRYFVSSLFALVTLQVHSAPDWTPSDLGQELTPWGAEVAGNEAGTIPEYTGGLKPDAGLTPGDGFWPNPFADEEPLFRITAENADEYADQLSAGPVSYTHLTLPTSDLV